METSLRPAKWPLRESSALRQRKSELVTLTGLLTHTLTVIEAHMVQQLKCTSPSRAPHAGSDFQLRPSRWPRLRRDQKLSASVAMMSRRPSPRGLGAELRGHDSL